MDIHGEWFKTIDQLVITDPPVLPSQNLGEPFKSLSIHPKTYVIGTATPATGIIATSVVIGSTTYDLGCIDSDLNGSPRFWLGQKNGKIIVN